jgi:hypothetical protein
VAIFPAVIFNMVLMSAGISDVQMKDLFLPFVPGKLSTQRPRGGFGLGLLFVIE